MATIGQLAVSVNAKTDKFRKGMRRVESRIKRLKNAIPGLNLVFSKMGAITAGLAGGGLLLLLKRKAEAIDMAGKFAKRIGVSTEALVGLEHAAGLTGVKVNQLRLGLQRMTRRVSEAAQGMGEAQGALKELGLDAAELNDLTVDEQFRRISDAMAKVEGQSNKVRLAFKLFDSEGVSLVNTLALGSDKLRELQEETKKLGSSFSGLDLAKVEAANDAMKRVNDVIGGFITQATIQLAPAVEAIANSFTKWATAGDGVKGKMLSLIRAVLRGVDAIQLAVARIRATFADIGAEFSSNFGLKKPSRSALQEQLEAHTRVGFLEAGKGTASAWFEGLHEEFEDKRRLAAVAKAADDWAKRFEEIRKKGHVRRPEPFAPLFDTSKMRNLIQQQHRDQFLPKAPPTDAEDRGAKFTKTFAEGARATMNDALSSGVADGIATGFENSRSVAQSFAQQLIQELISALGNKASGGQGGGLLDILLGVGRVATGGSFTKADGGAGQNQAQSLGAYRTGAATG
jgi:hypothetical protein